MLDIPAPCCFFLLVSSSTGPCCTRSGCLSGHLSQEAHSWATASPTPEVTSSTLFTPPQDLLQRSHHPGGNDLFPSASWFFPTPISCIPHFSVDPIPDQSSQQPHPIQPCHSPERVKFKRAPAPAVNPGFSALISVPVICISLLCAGFSSSLSPGPGARISIPLGLQGAPCCVPACAICRRHQFFSTFLISHYSQAQAAPHSTPSPAILPASW